MYALMYYLKHEQSALSDIMARNVRVTLLFIYSKALFE